MAFAYILPLLSGIADAVSRGVIKTTKVHNFTLVSAGFFFALPFYVIWLLIEGMPRVAGEFWWAVGLHVPLFTVANILTVEAHRRSPLILTMPYLSFTPAFLLVTAPIMGGGTPTLLGALGVLVLTVGLYILNMQSERASWTAPFRALFREPGSWMMLVVSFIFAVTSNLDYLALKAASAPLYLLVDHGIVAVVTFVLVRVYVRIGKAEPKLASPKGSWRPLMLYGFVIAFSVMVHMLAFRWIPVVPYVIASKRAGAILFTVGLGLYMAFVKRHEGFQDERKLLGYRLPGTFLMMVGMIVIIVWGKTA